MNTNSNKKMMKLRKQQIPYNNKKLQTNNKIDINEL